MRVFVKKERKMWKGWRDTRAEGFGGLVCFMIENPSNLRNIKIVLVEEFRLWKI